MDLQVGTTVTRGPGRIEHLEKYVDAEVRSSYTSGVDKTVMFRDTVAAVASSVPNRRGVHMAKTPARHHKEWSSTEVRELERLASQNTPTRVIGLKLGRTENSVRQKASNEGVSLKPTNQSPYNRRK